MRRLTSFVLALALLALAGCRSSRPQAEPQDEAETPSSCSYDDDQFKMR